jgi:hypothetical protein
MPQNIPSRAPTLMLCAVLLTAAVPHALAQTQPAPVLDRQTMDKLLDRLASDETRIKELEERLNRQTQTAPTPVVAAAQPPPTASGQPSPTPEAVAAPPQPTPAAPDGPPAIEAMDTDTHEHSMQMPGGGPSLQVRGYLDINFGVGTDANPLIFPLGVPAHSGFQAGEFALMASSQLSEKLSFMSELVIGSDPTNDFGLDVERYILSYKASKYFEAGVGRFHTAIGYYSTAYHHGTWFQTTTGRPFMYFFEDSGGLLPVHTVGATMTGLVPGTDKLGLHWVAEIGNGRSSNNLGQPVQNFYSDRNHKALNFAAYIAPEAIRGLQIGGSYYVDRLAPPGLAPVDQKISSIYGIYITPAWEFLNEGVLLSNHVENGGRTFNTPLAYSQISRKFGAWRPYFRYQYVNSPAADPINVFTGRYMGPSLGLRYDFADYAAFKLQYNRLDQRDMPAGNGLDAQVAFTF